MADEITIAINADTAPFARALGELEKLSERFGAQLTGALKSAIVSGKSLDDVLRQLALNLAGSALDAGLKPLQALASAFISRLAGGMMPAMPFAKGGIVPFAEGGIVSAPTYFPAGGRTGLMGEAGPEAILPLRRTSDGSLGVNAGATGAIQVTFNVTTPDAASFRKSEAEITAMLARAVLRGRRNL
ncbi:MAG: phage tail tape measure protein [Rhizobiaceae bacterium]